MYNFEKKYILLFLIFSLEELPCIRAYKVIKIEFTILHPVAASCFVYDGKLSIDSN
jgi:hypothetical protein